MIEVIWILGGICILLTFWLVCSILDTRYVRRQRDEYRCKAAEARDALLPQEEVDCKIERYERLREEVREESAYFENRRAQAVLDGMERVFGPTIRGRL